ncbi:coenzyme F420-dependent NADP oxidoreductase [Trichoderma citrinoviride]|uniref:Coenzyme F420-dependent NADP oxidoreductase n=1 Tax=Trichoderma citrinoviride TaxID=58853 RepID=A0A2T4B9T3_9HYPO|nr:coenzyme F420-dependent NADP oxidoreductase [Trichoderma citrinoviride]PTB66090.1 coenzyme F420-dependent NADP oxidoreductase [Trichoderma citrinoviride]
MEPSTSAPSRLTFIGGGCLAQALIRGIYSTSSSWKDDCKISVTARRQEQVRELRARFPLATVSNNNLDAAIWSTAASKRPDTHVVFICTLPIDVPQVCLELAGIVETLDVTSRPTVVTMCPGISVAQVQSWLPKETPVVRSMPNTPVMCRQGATALFPSESALPRIELVATVFRAVSPAISILPKESLLDVVAAISGSAPAHFYYLIESMISVAVSHGLSKDMARSLIANWDMANVG